MTQTPRFRHACTGFGRIWPSSYDTKPPSWVNKNSPIEKHAIGSDTTFLFLNPISALVTAPPRCDVTKLHRDRRHRVHMARIPPRVCGQRVAHVPVQAASMTLPTFREFESCIASAVQTCSHTCYTFSDWKTHELRLHLRCDPQRDRFYHVS